jgi:hypothetical protein
MALLELFKKWLSWRGGFSSEDNAHTSDQRQFTNAPLDPFGKAERRAAELASRFSIIRAKWALSTQGSFPKQETLAEEEPEAFFSPETPPKAVIFVSHRWESSTEPDPSGRQAAAVRHFLRMVASIQRKVIDPSAATEADLPSLHVHGVLQAAYFYYCGICFGTDGDQHWNRSEPPDFIDSIGIFYDYTSMPQNGISARLVEALQSIHELIGESTMLILRYPGDNYEKRAWCASELSIEPDIRRRQCRRIVLRLDKIGATISERELLGDSSHHFHSVRKMIHDRSLSWPTHPSSALDSISELYDFGMTDLEERQETPLFTTKVKPFIFPGQRPLLISMIKILGHFDAVDRSSRIVSFDIVSVVADVMKASGLETTNARDISYTGLLILYSRHRGAPEMALFYGECLKRLLANKTTMLVRYREYRAENGIRVWYVFSDDHVPNSSVPTWAN